MREGSLEAPVRHPLDWRNPEFLDEEKLDAELRRVFDVCHTCRRCFNLCDSFPRLFDLIDQSKTGELDSVASADFRAVADACTLCDMCFMTKCPYVPPHEFNIDFPHLMLRYRAMQHAKGEIGFATRELTKTDRNARLAAPVAPVANWATKVGNRLTRPLMERAAGIHREAYLPKFNRRTLIAQAKRDGPAVNEKAPAFGRKAVIYATCFANYNNPAIGLAARAVLAKNGVATEIVYPTCCGMPQLEHGNLADVAARARTVSAALGPWIAKGYDVIALVPSCALMMKFEWPLIVPGDEDIAKLSNATYDISEYVVDIAKKEGLAEGLKPLDREVVVHMACHARAQNIGQKAAEMLRLVPDTKIAVIERCSGHGGSWGIMKENFEVALKVGRPVARQAAREVAKAREQEPSGAHAPYLVSECPLAGAHIVQGMEREKELPAQGEAPHPIEILARAYGIDVQARS
ncbi:MAG: heterodisulfide reductase-related iron-sulfur binding cluster [Alphaproteobacteria bacterium]